MKLARRSKKDAGDDNLIPLINVVFLMLIFFLAAGALRPFREEGVKPAMAAAQGRSERPMGPILITAYGRMIFKGVEQDEEALMAILRARAAGAGRGAPLPIVADHALEARKLVKIMRMVRQAGIEKIRLVTRKRAGQ